MSTLDELAIARVPSAMRPEASKVAALLQDGYRPGDIAEQTGLPRQRIGEIQGMLRAAMVAALAADGYSPVESIRYLGVPTAMVTAHLP